jgi:hypothetical protein
MHFAYADDADIISPFLARRIGRFDISSLRQPRHRRRLTHRLLTPLRRQHINDLPPHFDFDDDYLRRWTFDTVY